jgi:hypothetical protein
MEVGTDPQRWKDVRQKQGQRKERAERTKVTVIEYSANQKTGETKLNTSSALRDALEHTLDGSLDTPTLRLFLVEDLSQQVIELFGSRYDIDPLFFREQIGDYNWFNTRDSWAMAPNLLTGIKRRSWFRMRHARFRYMPDEAIFKKAVQDSNVFNVFRRPDDDGNHWPYLDKKGAIVAMTRTKTSIWIGEDPRNKHEKVGLVLIDPTSSQGHPLWYGPVNWMTPPSMHQESPATRSTWPSTLYDLIVQATTTYPWFPSSETVPTDARIFAFPALYTICSEWLVIYEYLKARLSQIDWELEKPDVFRPKNDSIDSSLKRLHVWRRVLPVLREMLEETIEQALPAVARLISPDKDQITALGEILPDFQRVREALNELQRRVDRLSEVVVAEISIEDSRRSLKENHNLARLTWLATLFVPLSFLASFFSMTGDVTELKATIGWFFAAAVPLTALSLVVAGAVGRGWWFKKSKQKAKKFGKK